MRSKFASFGSASFDTYELLEMLLYAVVPYRDTNPIAKRLLHAHGSLDGVLTSSAEELMMTDGIGERSAEYLRSAGLILPAFMQENRRALVRFSDYCAVGEFLVDYFAGLTKSKVALLLLDNDLLPIDIIDMCEVDFQSAAVKPKPFVEAALGCRASVAILAHNHPFGPLFPSEGDRANNEIISSLLAELGVKLIEHYIVSGNSYSGFMVRFDKKLAERERIEEFIASKNRLTSENEEQKSSAVFTVSRVRHPEGGLLCELLKPILGEKSLEAEDRLFRRYQSLYGILDAQIDELSALTDPKCAVHIKLLARLTARRVTERFKWGRAYNDSEITEYLTGLFLGCSEEHFYLLSLNDKGELISCDLTGVGSLNSALVLPRKIVEIALKNKAAEVMFAHNHPGGNPNPSSEDSGLTMSLFGVLDRVGIRLSCHYIVSGNSCCRLTVSGR